MKGSPRSARAATVYTCQACGAIQPKWSGRCEACGAWNSLLEEGVRANVPRRLGLGDGSALELASLAGSGEAVPRWKTGMDEFDRVTGGGLVPGSAVLIGGDPGIGKSTLLLQVAAAASGQVSAAYFSGEEALNQIRLRARRLGIDRAPVALAAAAAVGDIGATLAGPERPAVVVIDSIQTLSLDTLDSAPGTVAQVRACVQILVQLAKASGFALVMVGHVTKEGLIAGPRVVEHMVDTVLYFEGERGHQFRILRAVKNRYGATDEIGVFRMTESGLAEVPNPSALFLADRDAPVPGCCVFAGLEGTRPVLTEIQSLTAPTALAAPRRAVVGWDGGRLAMVLAVLEARCGVIFSGLDVYLNVAGGARISEPAADLAAAAALASAASGRALPLDAVCFGEIGLAGEVRPVPRMEARLKEAAKLGFRRAVVPANRGEGTEAHGAGMSLHPVSHVIDLLAWTRDFQASPLPVTRPSRGEARRG